MKWLSNPYSKPEVGDTRYVMKFAFLPTYAYSISDNMRYKIWLMNYKQKQQYKEGYEYLSGIGPVPVNEWVEIQNMIA